MESKCIGVHCSCRESKWFLTAHFEVSTKMLEERRSLRFTPLGYWWKGIGYYVYGLCRNRDSKMIIIIKEKKKNCEICLHGHIH